MLGISLIRPIPTLDVWTSSCAAVCWTIMLDTWWTFKSNNWRWKCEWGFVPAVSVGAPLPAGISAPSQSWGSCIWFRKCQILTKKLTGQGKVISIQCLIFLNIISLRLCHYKCLKGVQTVLRRKFRGKHVPIFLVDILIHLSTFARVQTSL